MADILKLDDVYKSFGSTAIIRGVSLNVEAGERHAVIGPNGAGKSTLFHLISGLYEVSHGLISLKDQDITNRKPFEINRLGLGRSFQVTNIFPKMTVFENLRCSVFWDLGARYTFWRPVTANRAVKERSEELLELTGLTRLRGMPAGLLSYADQRALEIGITLGSDPQIIMLDEPTAGMSHAETDNAVRLIRQISRGKTLIMVEHDMNVVFDVADRISVLVYGKIIASDTPENIRANKAVQEAYLGVPEDVHA